MKYPNLFLIIFVFSFLFFTSCEKDSDLFSEYISETGKSDSQITDNYGQNGGQNTEKEISIEITTLNDFSLEIDEDVVVKIFLKKATSGDKRFSSLKGIYRTSSKGEVEISVEDDMVLYKPNSDFYGNDNLALSIEAVVDGNLTDVTLEVELIIRPVNDAMDDQASTSNNSSVTINVLNNDTYSDKNQVVVSEILDVSKGQVRINEDNTLTYIPNGGATGLDEFTYTTRIIQPDGSITNESAKVTLEILDGESSGKPTGSVEGGLKAFPSAYGAGAYTTGGRGGRVFVVTNLNNSGPGSLREAVEASGPRIVVFGVSGTINITSAFDVYNGDLTIAGQTAPAGGITLTGQRVTFKGADNVIVRYIRVRPRYAGNDALSFINCSDVILDHVSASWGGDEVLSFIGTTTNITIQRTLIAEGKTGSIIGDSDNPGLSENLSLHNSLYYNITHRFPNPNSNGRVDVVNNVVYNWKYRLMRTGGDIKLNHIGNYYSLGCLNSIDDIGNMAALGSYSPNIYTAGNYVDKDILTNLDADNWEIWQEFNGGNPQPLSSSYQMYSPFDMLGEPLPILSATEAFNDVVSNVGANARLNQKGEVILEQDALDELYLNNVSNGTCASYTSSSSNQNYDSTSHYSDFIGSVTSTVLSTGYTDSDKDGMPDEWEITNGFNPNIDDSSGDTDGDGYTNIEEFIYLVDTVVPGQ